MKLFITIGVKALYSGRSHNYKARLDVLIIPLSALPGVTLSSPSCVLQSDKYGQSVRARVGGETGDGPVCSLSQN